jgi:uncharacterized protein (TIGR02453 family)
MLQTSTLKFLQQLSKHNEKTWFEAHRDAYESARKDFSTFVQDVLDAHSQKDEDLSTLKAKDCIFRINRDIRFSKNKAPYKNNFGASLDRGGKKSIFAGYYLQIQPGDQSFLGGGLWMPEAPELRKIRQEIDYSWDEFRKILSHKAFKGTYGDILKGEYSLQTMPKGYEKDNPAAEYIKLKSFIALRYLSDEEVTSKSFLKSTLKAFEALQPLLNFLNRALDHEE